MPQFVLNEAGQLVTEKPKKRQKKRFIVKYNQQEGDSDMRWMVIDTIGDDIVAGFNLLGPAYREAKRLNYVFTPPVNDAPAEDKGFWQQEVEDLAKLRWETQPKMIEARFRGRCIVCGFPVEVGEDIFWAPGANGWHWRHGVDAGKRKREERAAGNILRALGQGRKVTIDAEASFDQEYIRKILGIAVAPEKPAKDEIKWAEPEEQLFSQKRKIRGL